MDLEEIVADVTDITEPSCMDKVLFYLDKLESEDEDYMKLLVEKLKDMEITWEQPWYQCSNGLTRPIKVNEDSNLETFRTDSMSKEESDRIAKNWKKFIKVYEVPNTPICLARWKNRLKCRNGTCPEERVRRFVIAYLARKLKRNLYQVFNHFITLYGNQVKGTYSSTEEKIMEICFHHNPKDATTYLSAVLGREPRGIYNRLSAMYNGRIEKKRLNWTLPLATKFLKLLMQYTGLNLEELIYKRFDKSIWIKLQEDMDQHYIYLQKFWYDKLHVQLFVKCDVKLNYLRRQIFKTLRSSPVKSYSYQVWSDIRWKEVLQRFPDGFTHSFLYNICFKILVEDKAYLQSPFEKIIEYGLRKCKLKKNRRLKTLAFKNGNLEIVQYDVKLKHCLKS